MCMSLDTLEPPHAPQKSEEIVELWPDGIPGGKAPFDEQTFRREIPGGRVTNMLRNVSVPTLTVYRPDPIKANGIGVIVAPGGGWSLLAWEHEGVEVAQWLAARGYSALLLKYRVTGTEPDPAKYEANVAAQVAMLEKLIANMKPPRSINELIHDERLRDGRKVAHTDGQRALALVRERGAEWGVKDGRVGMIGFSAGAYLTVDVALDPGGAPLLFAAPIYGGEVEGRPVPDDAPPLFIALTRDDKLLFRAVRGLYEDWTDAGKPAEFHAYERGSHGFGTAQQGLPVDRWMDLLADWLVDQGFA
jgi:acetyl esterase/lipase